MDAAAPLLELKGITKACLGVVALDGVSLRLHAGKVLGRVGENGAGKSTLLKVLGGVVRPDAGRLRLHGREYPHLTVAEAGAQGIAFVHHELSVFDNLDVAANVLVGGSRSGAARSASWTAPPAAPGSRRCSRGSAPTSGRRRGRSRSRSRSASRSRSPAPCPWMRASSSSTSRPAA